MEEKKNKRNKQDKKKMNCRGGFPPANKNKQADEKIKQPNHAQRVLDRRRLGGWRCYQRSLKLGPAAIQAVPYLRPQPRAPQPPRDLSRRVNFRAVDPNDAVPCLDTYSRGG